MGIKIIAVILLGVPVVAVILFEIILNGMALFNHGNVRLPAGLDAILRKVIVTPDMHRVHHSVRPTEYNRNFGFNLSVWDRVFDTYRGEPSDGHEEMKIGLRAYPGTETRSLFFLLIMPFRQ